MPIQMIRVTMVNVIEDMEERELLRIVRSDWRHYTIRHILRLMDVAPLPMHVEAMRKRMEDLVKKGTVNRSNVDCLMECNDHLYWRKDK